jgi:hypothetical protein
VNVVLLCSTIGCGHEARAVSDAAIAPLDAAPCWFDTYTLGGTVELGTGDVQAAFTPMPDSVPIIPTPQLGYAIMVDAQMTGMIPGNVNDLLDPSNPRTRFQAFFVDTGAQATSGHCGIRLAYRSSNGTDFELPEVTTLPFAIGVTESELVGRQLRVVVEIIDAASTYARDEKVITCQAAMP